MTLKLIFSQVVGSDDEVFNPLTTDVFGNGEEIEDVKSLSNFFPNQNMSNKKVFKLNNHVLVLDFSDPKKRNGIENLYEIIED
jgi:hypothetical protein